MIIYAARTSMFNLKANRAGLTRTTMLSPICGSDFYKHCTYFSSMAPPKHQFPLHMYIPSRVSLPPLQRSPTIKPESRKIKKLQDFVDRIPAAVHLRKTENIEPGAFDDPVARLFR